MACQAGDCHILAGEWKYVDGAAVWQIFDEQGMVTMRGKPGNSKHIRSSIIPGRVCSFRKRMTERVDVQSSSRQIFQKGMDAGG